MVSSCERQNRTQTQELEVLSYSRGREEDGVKTRKTDSKCVTDKSPRPLLNSTTRWLSVCCLGYSREMYPLKKCDQRSTGLKGTRNNRGVQGGTVSESLYPKKSIKNSYHPLIPRTLAVKPMSPQQEVEGLLSS